MSTALVDIGAAVSSGTPWRRMTALSTCLLALALGGCA